MKELMEKMMEKKKGKSADKKEAKMKVLKNLHKMASDAMGEDMKKVTVASSSKEGLEAGLDKAKELLKKKDEDNDK